MNLRGLGLSNSPSDGSQSSVLVCTPPCRQPNQVACIVPHKLFEAPAKVIGCLTVLAPAVLQVGARVALLMGKVQVIGAAARGLVYPTQQLTLCDTAPSLDARCQGVLDMRVEKVIAVVAGDLKRPAPPVGAAAADGKGAATAEGACEQQKGRARAVCQIRKPNISVGRATAVTQPAVSPQTREFWCAAQLTCHVKCVHCVHAAHGGHDAQQLSAHARPTGCQAAAS
jgi:hypothetical protein